MKKIMFFVIAAIIIALTAVKNVNAQGFKGFRKTFGDEEEIRQQIADPIRKFNLSEWNCTKKIWAKAGAEVQLLDLKGVRLDNGDIIESLSEKDYRNMYSDTTRFGKPRMVEYVSGWYTNTEVNPLTGETKMVRKKITKEKPLRAWSHYIDLRWRPFGKRGCFNPISSTDAVWIDPEPEKETETIIVHDTVPVEVPSEPVHDTVFLQDEYNYYYPIEPVIQDGYIGWGLTASVGMGYSQPMWYPQQSQGWYPPMLPPTIINNIDNSITIINSNNTTTVLPPPVDDTWYGDNDTSPDPGPTDSWDGDVDSAPNGKLAGNGTGKYVKAASANHTKTNVVASSKPATKPQPATASVQTGVNHGNANADAMAMNQPTKNNVQVGTDSKPQTSISQVNDSKGNVALISNNPKTNVYESKPRTSQLPKSGVNTTPKNTETSHGNVGTNGHLTMNQPKDVRNNTPKTNLNVDAVNNGHNNSQQGPKNPSVNNNNHYQQPKAQQVSRPQPKQQPKVQQVSRPQPKQQQASRPTGGTRPSGGMTRSGGGARSGGPSHR